MDLLKFIGMVTGKLTQEVIGREFSSIMHIWDALQKHEMTDEQMLEAQARIDALAHGRALL